MLPDIRTQDAAFSIPTFDLVPSDVEGFMDELREFQSAALIMASARVAYS